ncbi:acyl-CoA synthetase [Microbacterium sp. CSI-V]|uniref:acyl-CoA synthetase n=1 Tax=Microbacterium sp. CSI-V TaxID=1933777 RepID=UPI001EE6EC06|nr:acyl-CoA synthetase [Microbacterium sp. CSI-V]
MTTPASVRSFDVRHVQLARAFFAALAAVMVTFSSDHSAAVGSSVFSGFALATALVLVLSVWLVYPTGQRTTPILLAVVSGLAGLAASVGAWRTTTFFFVLVIVWAVVSGALEIIGAVRDRRAGRPDSRDGLTVGIITLILAVGILLTSPAFSYDYTIDGAGTFTLTGITIAVGIFGGYAAIIAVYLAIAGFSPRRPEPVPAVPAEEAAS